MTRRWADTDDTDIYEGRNVGPRYNRKAKKGGGVKEVKEHVISIHDGKAEFVFDDELIPLTKEGETTITRVSHVEPHPSKPGWLADMRPIGGPVLGSFGTWDESMVLKTVHMLDPFETRAEALAAEREWLRKEKGL